MNTQEFIAQVNVNRKQAATGWYQWVGEVNGKSVRIKGYKTWLQIAESEGVKHSMPMDISVKEFKACLLQLA